MNTYKFMKRFLTLKDCKMASKNLKQITDSGGLRF